MESAQANRLLVGDEMDLMPLVGQGLAQLGSQHTAAAESRITYDGNIHGNLKLVVAQILQDIFFP
jgi:hypothetical protein